MSGELGTLVGNTSEEWGETDQMTEVPDWEEM